MRLFLWGTNMADELKEFRDQFFAICRKPDFETQELTSTLKVVALEKPEIFEEHVDATYLENPEHQWSEGFFEQCMGESADVFSHRRLEHLLKVRDCLRNNGFRGFVPTTKKIESETMSTEFQPTENLKSNFQNIDSDPLQAQIALRLEIYNITKDSDYLINAVKWAEYKAPRLFSPYTTSAFKKSISENSEDWNADYFDIQTEYLSGNFSKKRYLHLIEVRQYLRDKGVEGFVYLPRQEAVLSSEPEKPQQTDPKASTPTSPHPSGHDVQPDSMAKALRIALMVGGAIAALLVLVFSMTR